MADSGPPQQEPVSTTRLYLGNLPRDVTKEEIQEHFKSGAGNITEVKLMNGFGFVEYDDAADARDVVPAFHGSDFKGQRLTVQFARGPRAREGPYGAPERQHPRPRRTQYRMSLTGLAEGTSWQDLKDFARQSGLDVVYSEVGRERDGRGFVEFETATDLRTAVEKLDNTEFKGSAVHAVEDIQAEVPQYNNHRGRSRSPPRRGGYGHGPPRDDYYGRRGPPGHGYDDRRGGGDYRRRTPPPRDDYYGRGRYDSPPRARGPPPGDYPPPRGGYRDDPYGAPPPRRYDDPYAGGYDRPPPRQRSPPRGYGGAAGAAAYDERPPRADY